MTNLPKHSVNFVRPFLQTGIDYTEHLWVKQKTGTTKMFILIFTCLSVRAVHIELVEDMTSTAFVQALIRFTNVHGIPSHIYSDNARSFSTTLRSDIIEQHVHSDNFDKQFENYKIKHIKIPLYSNWVGSTWERLIRAIKSCLYKIIGRSKIEYFELLTLLSDIQNAINTRPLTYRCSFDSDLQVIIPNCFCALMLTTNSF